MPGTPDIAAVDAALLAVMDVEELTPAAIAALSTAQARAQYQALRDTRRAAKARVEGHVRGDRRQEVLEALWQAYERSAPAAHRLLLRVQEETYVPGTCALCDRTR